jgi:acetyltransferase-like isoleucine patch superfamily enzyme
MSVIDREGMGGRLNAAADVCIDASANIDISADVTIGAGSVISEDVLILTHDHDPDDLTKKHATSLTIGEQCWLGARCIILPRVRYIGARTVIGAGSVLTHDTPGHELYVGNPAVKIRDL